MQLFRREYPALGFLLVHGICRLGVPLFLMISGYYFFRTDNFAKFRHWFVRIGLLYLVWMAAYLPFWYRKTPFIDNVIPYSPAIMCCGICWAYCWQARCMRCANALLATVGFGGRVLRRRLLYPANRQPTPLYGQNQLLSQLEPDVAQFFVFLFFRC